MILIVEDDADSAEMLGRLLKRSGYDSVIAPTARAALELLAERTIRVAVIDFNLPDLDGIALLKLMKADPALGGVRTIFLSGNYGHEVCDRAFAAGTSGWFIKGVDHPNKVIEAVKQAYGNPPAG